MKIRPAESSDLRAAFQLWFDRIALLQQTDPQIKLSPDAKVEWRRKAEGWIADEGVSFLVAVKDAQLIGFVAVAVEAGKPALQPQRTGVLLEMAVDLHETHHGLSETLLDAARRWLVSMDTTQLVIDVPARYPVEAAFWRAQGARLRFERHWLEL